MGKTHLKKCRLCGSLNDSSIIKVSDYIHNTGKVYDYFECKVCNSLNLINSLSPLNYLYTGEYG